MILSFTSFRVYYYNKPVELDKERLENRTNLFSILG
jgi:hypothetical protein